MTSSMQLAQECLKDPPEASEEPPAPLEGLEMFAQTIETGKSLGRPCLFRWVGGWAGSDYFKVVIVVPVLSPMIV